MTDHESKLHILTTALAVFAEKGFAKASMNDVVRASGLSKGGVYWHFSSKDALIAAIFDHFFTGQLAVLDEVMAAEETAVTKLTQLAALTVADVEVMATQFPSPLEFYALAAKEAGLQTVLQTHFASYRQKISRIIQQGIDGGEFGPVNADTVAKSFIALFEGMLLIWAVSPEAVDLRADMQTAVQLLIKGLPPA